MGVLALAGGVYAAARESSAFAIARIVVVGAPRDVRDQVQRALAPLRGTSLLALDGSAVVRRVEALPTVMSATSDRGFPHTLRVEVLPERTVAVLHRGRETWLVSARGRVVRRVVPGSFPALPRIWVPRATPFAAGSFLAPADGGIAAAALALAARFPARIATASFTHGQLVLRLRSGLELRLGDATDIRLKLAIARRADAVLPLGSAYVDLSLPGRPVAGSNPQLSSGG